jgi:spore cortex formation protein SpoVR/YcgB (stage V sporulation)
LKKVISVFSIVLVLFFSGCTQETQNKLGRSIQNWTGTNGVLDIYMGEKLVQRFIKIDKLSTAMSTDGTTPRHYRYGYGFLDLNQNYKVDDGEKKLYFEISNYSTSYVFYENPGFK